MLDKPGRAGALPPAPKPSYRTVPAPGGEDTGTLRLLENPLDTHYLDIGEDVYGGAFIDAALQLTCNLVLHFRHKPALFHNPFKDRVVMPVIDTMFLPLETDTFMERVCGDGELVEALLVQFHLRLLEKLLAWCAGTRAATLMLDFEDSSLAYWEIYRPFTTPRRTFHSRGGKKTSCAIPLTGEVPAQVIKSLHGHEQVLRQKLWAGKMVNPAFRQYLKTNPF